MHACINIMCVIFFTKLYWKCFHNRNSSTHWCKECLTHPDILERNFIVMKNCNIAVFIEISCKIYVHTFFTGVPVIRHNLYYACCENPYPDVTFWLVLRRKPLYYLFNLLTPCLFIVATTILVFYLPPDCGEKISLSVTGLLALTVFLLMVAEALPPQSDSIPLIGEFNLLSTEYLISYHLLGS